MGRAGEVNSQPQCSPLRVHLLDDSLSEKGWLPNLLTASLHAERMFRPVVLFSENSISNPNVLLIFFSIVPCRGQFRMTFNHPVLDPITMGFKPFGFGKCMIIDECA